jgi:hypothetical protein
MLTFFVTLKIEAVRSSEMLLRIYQKTVFFSL